MRDVLIFSPKSWQERWSIYFYHKDTSHLNVGNVFQCSSQWGVALVLFLTWPEDKETFVLVWVVIFQSAVSASVSSKLCSDWDFTADWVNLASHPQTVPPAQLLNSSSFLFFAQYPTSLSRWPLWVPLLFAGLSLAAQICSLPPSALTFPFSCLLLLGWLPVCPLSILCSSLFRAEVSAPQYQSVGHSGADQSISGTGSFRGEGANPGSFTELLGDSWPISRCYTDEVVQVFWY